MRAETLRSYDTDRHLHCYWNFNFYPQKRRVSLILIVVMFNFVDDLFKQWNIKIIDSLTLME